MKLNIPMITTWIIDFSLLGAYCCFAIYFIKDNFNPVTAIIAIFAMVFWTIMHDHIYWILFENLLAPEKLKLRYDFHLVKCTLKISTTIAVITALDVYGGNFHFEWNGLETVLLIIFEYNFMIQAKDNTSMRFIHSWMHKKENYWIHEHHHIVTADCQTAATFHFDLLDVFLENICGTILMRLFYFSLGKTASIHLLSYIIVIWSDQMGHSMNPYVPCFMNPIFDYILKINCVHNLHHLLGAAYYMTTPYNHLYDPDSANKDLEKYNKRLKTNVSFNFLLDDDCCQLNDETLSKMKKA